MAKKTQTPIQKQASKGGKARARALTPEQRSEQARAAVEVRWQKAGKNKAPRSTHEGRLILGKIEIACCVLDNQTRVITHRALQRSLGMAESGGAQRMVSLVESIQRKGVYAKDLATRIANPIKFVPKVGAPAFGYEATVIADLCDLILEARKSKALGSQRDHIADRCEILVRGFARVGIIALVDEATGYQDYRARDALAEILEKFVARELRKWVRTFPPDFYKELFRLRKLKYPPDKNPPQYIGRLTNNIIYDRLAPGVLEELKARNPVNERGNRRVKHHQWLTEDTGHPKLLQHLSAVIALMRVSTDYPGFKNLLNKALPKYGDAPLFEQRIADGAQD